MPASTQAIVLSGGGANGAYEVGVMEALFSGRSRRGAEPPVEPTVFIGTSVGSYNAAAMVSLSTWGMRAAARRLRDIWLDRIGQDGIRPNGVYRIRGSLANLPRDAFELTTAWLPRALDLAFTDDAPTRRILRIVDGGDVMSTSPLESLISETLNPVQLLHSLLRLRIVACNWDTGGVVVFANNRDPDDGRARRRDYESLAFTEANVGRAILASTAIPGIFPRVQIGGAYFVDGGVVMNTPLLPAIDAKANVLHVVHLEPKLAPLPLGRAPSALESMERILAATPARLIDADVQHAMLVNDVESERALRRAPRRGGETKRQLVIHRYYPRGQIGGVLGLLDFRKTRLIELMEQGFRDAVEHDCQKNGCALPQRRQRQPVRSLTARSGARGR